MKDYIELNYLFGFTLTMVKEFDSCVILTDTLKERKVDDASIAYLKEEITTEEYLDKMDEEIRKMKNPSLTKGSSTKLRRKLPS
ncbi:MAG: hypothetical protein V8T16_17500 [Parabacteroides merdae]